MDKELVEFLDCEPLPAEPLSACALVLQTRTRRYFSSARQSIPFAGKFAVQCTYSVGGKTSAEADGNSNFFSCFTLLPPPTIRYLTFQVKALIPE
jgi:uncharacterized membrane protein (GlpM family)